MVMFTEAWPSSCWTSLGCVPRWKRRVAHAWRSWWKETSRILARFKNLLYWR